MKRNIIYFAVLLASVIFLNSCLKDDEFDNWKEDVKGKMYITIASPGLNTQSVLPNPDPVTIDILINFASDKVPSQDYTVNLALDDAAIAVYDSTLKADAIAANDTLDDGSLNWKDYKPYPSIVLNTPTVTIKKGVRVAYAQVTIDRADTIKIDGNYMFAITITDMSGGITIAQNMKTALYALPVANEWEGDYNSVGYRDHPTAGIQPFNFPKQHFATVNTNTVWEDKCGNYGGYGTQVEITDQVIVVKGQNCYKCNITLVDNGDDPGTDWGQTNVLDGEPMNYYNPATKTFELYFWYNSGAPRIIRETDIRL